LESGEEAKEREEEAKEREEEEEEEEEEEKKNRIKKKSRVFSEGTNKSQSRFLYFFLNL
jgi:hypothetical protein